MTTAANSLVSVASLVSRLGQLKLAGMKKTLEIRLQQAGGKSMAYEEFLGLLLEDEFTNRMDNRNRDRLKAAHFPFEKGLEDFDFTFQPSIQKRDLLELATGNFLASHTNILFIGQPGTGKTHLSVALGLRALALGRKVLFVSLWEMLEGLSVSRADLSVTKKLHTFLKPDLLIIDELGYKSLPPQAVQDLFEILVRRYEKSSTIVTTNRNLVEWDKIFQDKTLTTALLDKFLHHSRVFEIKGDSYRRREQQHQKPLA
jgi:DNA replication protein DnaC